MDVLQMLKYNIEPNVKLITTFIFSFKFILITRKINFILFGQQSSVI